MLDKPQDATKPCSGYGDKPDADNVAIAKQEKPHDNQYKRNHALFLHQFFTLVNRGGEMKKIVLALALVCLFACNALAAGSAATITARDIGSADNKVQKKELSIAWTTDDSAGTVSATINAESYGLLGYILYSLETDPGSTAPTDDYDITVKDTNGLDLCAGNGANRDTSNTEMVACTSSTQPYGIVRGNLTFAIAAGGNSKVGTAILIFVKD